MNKETRGTKPQLQTGDNITGIAADEAYQSDYLDETTLETETRRVQRARNSGITPEDRGYM